MVILLVVTSVVATKRKRLHQRRHYQRLSTVLDEV